MSKTEILTRFQILIVFICAWIVESRPETPADLADYDFRQYLRDFRKGQKYDFLEFKIRKKIFDANLERVRKHNSIPDRSWWMNVN